MDQNGENWSARAIDELVTTIATKEGFKNFKIEKKQMSTEGANFMGDLFIVDVVEDGKDTLKLFAKVTNIPEAARAFIPAHKVYENEVYMYTTVADAFRELEEKHKIPEKEQFKFVKYYGSSLKNLEEVIVLENLSAQKYEVYDRFKTMDWEYAKAALKQIAKFHAVSFALKKEKPDMYDTFAKTVKNPFNQNMEQQQNDMAMQLQVQACLSFIDDENKGRVAKYIQDNKDSLILKHINVKSENNVIIHGDYRVSNILVKYQANSVISLKPIDYQTASYGSPVLDIIYLIFTCTDEDFRRQYFEECLQFYYESFADHLKLFSLDVKYVFPKSTFYFELKERLTFGIDIAIFILRTILVDNKDKVDLGDMVSEEVAMDAFDKMKPSKRYIERLNEIIRDFVRWGYLNEEIIPIESLKHAVPADNKDVKNVKQIVRTIAEKEGFQNFQTEITPISTEGANYLGELFLVDVTESGKETLKLFAKASNINEQARALVPANHVYKNEVFMYTNVAEAFQELQERHGVPVDKRFKFVKYYGSNVEDMNEVIVLENMVAQGYEVYDRFKPVDWAYAKAAVEELAKFHALSLALKQEMPESFERLQSNVTNIMMDNIKPMIDANGDAFFALSVNIVDEKYKDIWRKYIEENKFKFITRQFESTSKYKVIVHGDYRMSNILHKYQGSDVVSLKPIDYQTAFCGTPVIDILYFLFTGSDEEFRREYFEDYLEHYYNSLAAHLKLLSQDVNYIFPRSAFYFEVKEMLPFGIDIGLFVLGTVLVDPRDAMKMDDMVNEESMKERISKMEPNKLYKERLNGLVRDFVRWGYLAEEGKSEEQQPVKPAIEVNGTKTKEQKKVTSKKQQKKKDSSCSVM